MTKGAAGLCIALDEYFAASGLPREDWCAISALVVSEDTQPGGLSLRLNFSWTFVGNTVYAACQWGMLVVLAKLTTPETVGQFALGMAVTAPVIMFANLQLRAVQATDARRQYQFGHYLGLRLVMSALALVVVLAIVAFSHYTKEAALVILMVGLAKSFESISDVIYGLLQHHERMDRIATSMILKGPLSLIALSLCVYFTRSAVWGAMGLALAWLVVLCTYDLRSAVLVRRNVGETGLEIGARRPAINRSIRPRWDLAVLLKLALLALPLGATQMLNSLGTNLPRQILERYHGEQSLGIFAALAYLVVAGGTIVGALGQSASPRLASYYAMSKLAQFRRLLGRLLLIGVALTTVGLLIATFFGRTVLTVLYRPEYGQYATLLVWMAAAGGVSYLASFLGYAITATRQFRVQLPLFAIIAVSCLALCYLFIPHFGMVGAAWAILISNLIQLLGTAWLVARALAAREAGDVMPN